MTWHCSVSLHYASLLSSASQVHVYIHCMYGPADCVYSACVLLYYPKLMTAAEQNTDTLCVYLFYVSWSLTSVYIYTCVCGYLNMHVPMHMYASLKHTPMI